MRRRRNLYKMVKIERTQMYLEMIASKLEMDMQQLLEANEKEQSNFNATQMNMWIPLLS